jgi:hypothetical protein
MRKCFVGGCVKDSGVYLNNVFQNIKLLKQIFDEIHIIIAYDNSKDNSLKILEENKITFKKFDILINTNPLSERRTENISNARNSILNKIHEYKKMDIQNEWNYFIMMDSDEICGGKMEIDVLNKYLIRDDWDALSFNRSDYYDIWALSFNPFVYSCWHWTDPNGVVYHTRETIQNKLKELQEDELFECFSAFNGFAIYKIDKFIDCKYDWNMATHFMDKNMIEEQKKIFHDHELLEQTYLCNSNLHVGDCEHRHFHLQAIHKHNAKIRISPLFLFTT